MSTFHWRPTCPRSSNEQRVFLYRCIRDFFSARQVMEVETPALSRYGNTDPQIESFQTGALHESFSNAYLRTSPEFFHKRLLAAGWGDIFEIGKVFRRDESTPLHNFEFSLLEWYRERFTMEQLMDELVELLQTLSNCFKLDAPIVERISYVGMFEDMVSINPLNCSLSRLNSICNEHGYAGTQLDKNQCLDFLFAVVIQPQLNKTSCQLIHHFPASQAALAAIDPENPQLALRFELLWQGIELANGYQELTCASEQAERFGQENLLRSQRQQETVTVDEYFLAALHAGMPECSGVAVGLDRLLMCLTGCDNISQVLAFPTGNA